MRSTIAFTSFYLIVVAGCATSGGGGSGTGGNGDGGPPTNQNDNEATTNDNVSDGPDANDDSDDLPTAFRLDGVWDDNGRHTIIEQNGVEVQANYFSEYICDLDTGPIPVDEDPAPGANTETTFFSFGGTLNNGEDVLPGDIITGKTSICLYGSINGIILADLTLTVVDENTMSGEWEADSDGDGETDYSGSATLTREQ